MADRGWKVVNPFVFGRSLQLLLNKFFDPITPLRNLDDWRKKKKRREESGENSGPLTSLPVDCLNSDRQQH